MKSQRISHGRDSGSTFRFQSRSSIEFFGREVG